MTNYELRNSYMSPEKRAVYGLVVAPKVGRQAAPKAIFPNNMPP